MSNLLKNVLFGICFLVVSIDASAISPDLIRIAVPKGKHWIAVPVDDYEKQVPESQSIVSKNGKSIII